MIGHSTAASPALYGMTSGDDPLEQRGPSPRRIPLTVSQAIRVSPCGKAGFVLAAFAFGGAKYNGFD
jgi:hypothetical protein